MAHFVDAGGRAAASPAEAAADADVVMTVVVNGAQTEAVLFGENGAARRMTKGGTILSFATMPPQMAEDLARRAAELGLGYIDATDQRRRETCRSRRAHGDGLWPS